VEHLKARVATSLKTGWQGEDISSISIGQLIEYAPEERCAFILQTGEDHLAITIETLRDCDAPFAAAMTPLRLAWALSSNLDGNAGGLASRRGIRNYLDQWRPEVKWNNIWTLLTEPLPGGGSEATSLLAELCLSVACEQRDDWQNESSRPLDLAAANQAFHFVYEKSKAKVAGYVFKRFGQRAGAPEVIADEAWARMFCDYWSVRARRRFLGLSRISTLVCQVAHHIAYDVTRELEKSAAGVEAAGWDRNCTTLRDLGLAADSSGPFQAEELHQRIQSCLSLLPARQRIVATMVWVREMQAKRVAQVLQISAPAVSEHLKKARDAMRKCLRIHGFQVSGEATE
jgi:RNA polymerase sigma factor (sigma-70 family)